MDLVKLRLMLCCNLKPGIIMKKTLFTLGLAIAATLTLTNCAKQEAIIKDAEPAKQGVPFELVAGMDTKTEATDAGVVTWKEGDKLNVFHAEAGSTSYGSNDQFTFSSGSSFTGTLSSELTADAYDWYALYPYYSGIETPANTSKGYTTFRNAQTQVGNDSMAHLCGSNMPLYGKKTNVAKDTKPSIEMKQAASIIKVHVTNKLDAALTVASVSVTAPVNIAGNYFINFAGDTPSFTESSSSGKKTVTLTVSGGDPIAKDGSADFYIAVMPFSVSSGTITVSVNGYGKDKSVSSETVFAAGKIKTFNFGYDHVDTLVEPTSETGWYRVEKADWLVAGDRVIIANHDGTKAMSKTYKANNRDGVAVTTAASGDYTVLTNNDNVQMFILEDGTASGSFAFWADNGDDASKYMYAASSSANNLKFQETLDANASFVAALVNGLGNLTAQGSNTHKIVQWNNLFNCYTEASYNSISIYKYYGAWAGSTTCAAPVISQEGTTVSITCTTPGATIYYTTNGDDPNPSNSEQKYTHAFSIASAVTVKAIAVKSHYTNSSISSQACTPKVATPVISCSGTSFTITCATDGASIYYTTSTTDLASVVDPTSSSTAYSAAVSITQTTYVKAIAYKDGYTTSAIASATCEYASGSPNTYSCTFTTAAWGTTGASDFTWTSVKDGGGFSNNGIQVTSNTSNNGANANTNTTFTGVSQVIVTYNTNKSAGAGTLELKIGTGSAHEESWAYGGSGDGRSKKYTCTFNVSPAESGVINLKANTTTNSIYIVGVTVKAISMSTP